MNSFCTILKHIFLIPLITLHWHLFPRVKGDLGEYGNDGKGPVWWLPQEIMWNKDNIPNEKELKKMKAKLLKELEKYV